MENLDPVLPADAPDLETAPVVFDDGTRDRRAALMLAAAYLLFFQVTIRLPFDSIFAIAFTTLISLLLVLAFTVRAARAMRTGRAAALNLLASGLLALPTILLPLVYVKLHIVPMVLWYLALPVLWVPGLRGLVLMWFAAAIGVLISRLVREMKILLPAAVVLALVDLYVVFGGGLVTQAQSDKAPAAQAAMKALTVTLPTAQPRNGAAPMQLAIGFADFLFIALFFACFARFRVASRRTFGVMCGVLAVYMGYVAVTGIALPALVPIAIVVIGMNLRQFRYERSEAFALLYAGLIVGAVGSAFYFLSHR